MTVPFRIGVMQLTMEPLDEMLASARVMDEAGMDTIWLAEAYDPDPEGPTTSTED